MEAYDIIHALSRKSKVPMQEIAKAEGVSVQAFYKSLHGNIGLFKFQRMVERCGYRLVIVDQDNKLVTRL